MANMIEKDLLDSLDDLGYQGSINDPGALAKAVEDGVAAEDFTDLISWLSGELKLLYDFEEKVHPISGQEDEGTFLVEVSSFIREMNCPYPTLTEGPISQRLATPMARKELLNYLVTELQAARMTVGLKKEASPHAAESRSHLAESSTAAALKSACMALGLPKPPDTVTSQQLFSKLADKVKDQSSKLPKDRLGNPLFIGGLNKQQWEMLEQLNNNMKLDYMTRAELLIQRLDVTVQSFTWSDRVKKQEDNLLRVYRPLRQLLKTTSNITVAHLLAARDDLTTIEKTANSNLRAGTVTKLNKLLIANRPPDRGGRPTEIQAPPPEMPSWQKRVPGRGGGQFGGAPQGQRQVGGGRGSGRVQGGGWQGGSGSGAGGGGRQDNYNKGYQQQYSGGRQGHYGADSGNYYQQPYQQGGYSGGYGQQMDQHYGGGGYQQRGRGGRGRGGGKGQW